MQENETIYGNATGIPGGEVLRLVVGTGPYYPQSVAVFYSGADPTAWKACVKFGDDSPNEEGAKFTLRAVVLTATQSSHMSNTAQANENAGGAYAVSSLPVKAVTTVPVYRNTTIGTCT